jgi:hypothetical protein
MIALAIGALALSGAAALNSQQLRMVGDSRKSSAAAHALQERLEEVRFATWKQITDVKYVTSTFFSRAPRSIAPLANYEESISVTSWPAGEGTSAKLHVTKTAKAAPFVVSAGDGLVEERLLRIVVQLKWVGSGGIEHTRELATLLSNGGISRVNLPSMGPIGGGVWDTVLPEVTSDPEIPPSGEEEPAETQTDPQESTTPSAGNAGNGAGGEAGSNENRGNPGSEHGKGRGNVGGTPGIK